MYKYKSLQAGQLPWEHLSFLKNLLNFIITKNLKQDVHDYVSVYVNERSPFGLSIIGNKYLSLSRDQKVMTFTNPVEKYPMDFYQRVVFTAQIW